MAVLALFYAYHGTSSTGRAMPGNAVDKTTHRQCIELQGTHGPSIPDDGAVQRTCMTAGMALSLRRTLISRSRWSGMMNVRPTYLPQA